jgi:hypothetical protein
MIALTLRRPSKLGGPHVGGANRESFVHFLFRPVLACQTHATGESGVCRIAFGENTFAARALSRRRA